MFADSNYRTTDTLSYGYGEIRNQYDLQLTHDIKDEFLYLTINTDALPHTERESFSAQSVFIFQTFHS